MTALLAVLHGDAQTLHSFSGIGVPHTHSDFAKMQQRRNAWLNLRALIIDEVSLASAELLDLLSSQLILIRQDHRPFGGLQVIVCGCFLQFPPVRRTIEFDEKRTACERNEILFENRGLAFQSRAWRKANFKCITLTHQFRQHDVSFVTMLDQVRLGVVTEDMEAKIRSLARPLPVRDGIIPTKLYAKKADTNSENLHQLQLLPPSHGPQTTFPCFDGIDYEDGARQRDPLSQEFKALYTVFQCQPLQLRVGAQVMALSKVGPTIVNGSRGVVIAFQVRPS